MSAEITMTVNIPTDITTMLSALTGCQRTITEGAAMGVEAALRDHFLALQERPRQDGFDPVGFWYDTDGNSVAEQIGGHVLHDDGRASVTIDSPELRHKLDGGTIKASDYGHPFLTIPNKNEAAHAPQGSRSFICKFAWRPHPDGGWRPALVSEENYVKVTRSRKTGETRRKYQADSAKANAGAGDVLFWLVRKVTHKPMADALPSDGTLGDAARDAALDALDALLASGGKAA